MFVQRHSFFLKLIFILIWYFQFNTANNAGDKDSDVSANNEVAVQLCSGDRILVIISKNGNLGNNVGNVFGTTETRTVLVITKLWYT